MFQCSLLLCCPSLARFKSRTETGSTSVYVGEETLEPFLQPSGIRADSNLKTTRNRHLYATQLPFFIDFEMLSKIKSPQTEEKSK